MKHQKPLAVRIFIRICVIFMTVSLIGVYVVYMFAPNQEAGEDNQGAEIETGVVEAVAGTVDENGGDNGSVEENLILPEIDSENPENTEAPILVTEDGEIDEMDRMFQVQLGNGEMELISQSDLGDSIQITQ